MTALGPGVRVKCIHEGPWFDILGISSLGPEFGSVWTIAEVIRKAGPFIGPFIRLRGWIQPERPMLVKWFVPLDGNEDISALIDAFTKGVVDGERARIVERVR